MNEVLLNDKSRNLRIVLLEVENEFDEVNIASAFFNCVELIEKWLSYDKKIKLLVSLRPTTDYYALNKIFFNDKIQLKFLNSDFHSKLIVLKKNSTPFLAIIGSSNFTKSGLDINIETNLITKDKKIMHDINLKFKTIWEMGYLLEKSDMDKYKNIYDKFRENNSNSDAEDLLKDITKKRKESEIKNKDKIFNDKKIISILESIVCGSIKLKKRRDGANYIPVEVEQIKQIHLSVEKDDENNWHLRLGFWFGDTQRQATFFYKSVSDILKIKNLEQNGWTLSSNFHVSFRESNLVHFRTRMSIENYIDYWKKNINSIYQRGKNEVNGLLDLLDKNNVINYDNEKQNEMENEYFSKKMTTLNICPGFGITYKISSKETIEKDTTGKLVETLSQKIEECLSIINLDWKNYLNAQITAHNKR